MKMWTNQKRQEIRHTRKGIPTGTMYHLNSKRLKTCYLQRIAAILGVAEYASTEDTRTAIEGKLWEMGKDPAGTDNGTLYM